MHLKEGTPVQLKVPVCCFGTIYPAGTQGIVAHAYEDFGEVDIEAQYKNRVRMFRARMRDIEPTPS